MQNEKKNTLQLLLFSLFVSAIFIAICSKNSFLYPLQDWVDVNCYFTVGKSIANGKILYQEVFDHKGPVLHFLYALAYLISNTTFLGVYILETVSIGLFLFLSGKCLQFYTKNNTTIYCILALIAFTITTSSAYAHGGSVEGLCLFCLCMCLYTSLRALRQGIENIPSKLWLVNGLCVGFVFWIKYTMLGLYIGAFLFFFIYILCARKKNVLLPMIGFVALGFIIVTLPILVYFIVNGALFDLWDAYFYKNIFLYSAKISLFTKLITVVFAVYDTVIHNLGYALFITIGIFWALYKRNLETLFLIVALSFWALGTYIGGVTYFYYGFTLASFTAIGFGSLIDIFKKNNYVIKAKTKSILLVVLLIVLPITSYFVSDNTYLMSYSKEDIPQFIFAKEIEKTENATLLNYGFLDGGFYFAANAVPSYKFFCEFNMDIPELTESMDNAIKYHEVDFVVTKNETLESIFGDVEYECIKEADYFFEDSLDTYYLYKRIQ